MENSNLPSKKCIQHWDDICEKSRFSNSIHREKISAFLKLVDKEYKSRRPLKKYAEDLRIESSTLRKACHKVIKHSPKYCIQLRILAEACKLLLESTFDVKEISHTLGFDDDAYFSRFFKKHTGQTPSTVRKTSAYVSSELTD